MKPIEMRKIEAVDIMRYYVTFIDVEKKILDEIKSPNLIVWENALKIYMNQHMKIGRNFRTGTDHMVLRATLNHFREGKQSVEKLSSIFFTNELLNNKIENAKVAASKLLWLFNQETIIMDNYNKDVLRVSSSIYDDYVKVWMVAFETKLPEIEKVILENNFQKIDMVMNEKWFKMRVFDQYLWSLKK
jgi:hypothetical protein